MPEHFVSASCRGERCNIPACQTPPTHKVGEELMHDDPIQISHNLTAYLCCQHFEGVMQVNCPPLPKGAM